MDYIFQLEAWLILALVLVAADILLSLDFILLSFGIGAALTGAALYYGSVIGLPLAADWRMLLTFFALSSLGVLFPLRKYARKSATGKSDEDINKY